MLTSIKDKSVIVTGGSRGIGKGIAQVFASKGAKVLVVSRDDAAAKATAADIIAQGGVAAGIGANVASETDIAKIVETAIALHGGVDILCANAGIFPNSPIGEMTSAEWSEVLDVNLKGTFMAVSACLPAFKKAGKGRVVITSSITGAVTADKGWSHYAASKAGQLGFMRVAALELAEFNITVNAVLPGNILTEGLASMGPDYAERMAAAIPLKRLGSPEDIAYAALFLASDEAAYITGQTIIVDGGQVLPES
jgi:3-oxoacyl-[acyl-carrier protein] reductase